MGIRDWFAGMAMQALLSKDSARMEYEILADVAYDIADSMMERKEDE